MADPARARKIADRIKVVAAEYLERRLKDERLGFVTVTDVRVTGDLQHASIFYTVFGSDEERAASAEAIQDNLGRIRSHVGKALGIRLTPTLEFIADALPESSSQIEDALRKARQRDEELAAQRAQAAYAGEPDPYKKPVSDEDDEDDEDDPQEDPVNDENVNGTDGTDDTVDGYAPVPPPASVQDGGEDAQDAAELGAVAGVDVTDEDEDEKQGTGRTDG